jgi:hypothetical protein
MILIIALQTAVALLGFLFGVQALGVTRALSGTRAAHHAAWELTAVGFLVAGVSSVVWSAFAVWAVAAGPGSAAWNGSVTWMPVGNYGRSVAKAMLALLLCCIPWLAGLTPRARGAASLGSLLAMFAAGGVYGYLEGPLRSGTHFSIYAVFQTAELILLLAALFIAVLQSSMDRWLWAILAIYGVRQALNALSVSALAWLGIPGRWALSPMVVHLMGVASYLMMMALAHRRLQLARRRVAVPGMFDLPKAQPSLLH